MFKNKKFTVDSCLKIRNSVLWIRICFNADPKPDPGIRWPKIGVPDPDTGPSINKQN